MTIYREIKSMMVLDGNVVMTLSCGHSYRFKRGYFRSKHINTNASGKQVWRCSQCEKQAEGGLNV